mmetsp:Transcript_54534/g.162933  ORF Transcript_54534/g.162933 Transcript_54534/m.162933 type:complete len:234 (-) Transcript_54534:103-804(-)
MEGSGGRFREGDHREGDDRGGEQPGWIHGAVRRVDGDRGFGGGIRRRREEEEDEGGGGGGGVAHQGMRPPERRGTIPRSGRARGGGGRNEGEERLHRVGVRGHTAGGHRRVLRVHQAAGENRAGAETGISRRLRQRRSGACRVDPRAVPRPERGRGILPRHCEERERTAGVRGRPAGGSGHAPVAGVGGGGSVDPARRRRPDSGAVSREPPREHRRGSLSARRGSRGGELGHP